MHKVESVRKSIYGVLDLKIVVFVVANNVFHCENESYVYNGLSDNQSKLAPDYQSFIDSGDLR